MSCWISLHELADQRAEYSPDRRLDVVSPHALFVVEKFADISNDRGEGNDAGDEEKSPEAVDAQAGGR